MQNYGNKWRLHRRVFHQSFNTDALRRYQNIQMESARRLAAAILRNPKDLAKQTKL